MSINITPVKHEEVPFYDAKILAVTTDDGQCYYSPRHVSQNLGLDWASQFTKIKNDPFLEPLIRNITIQLPGTSQRRKYTMLPIATLAGWLLTIKRARPEVQDTVNRYRLEAFHVLHDWFQKGLKDNHGVIRTMKQENITDPVEAARQWADNYEKDKNNKTIFATHLHLTANELERKENAGKEIVKPIHYDNDFWTLDGKTNIKDRHQRSNSSKTTSI
ncbi:phage antirepressor N-terminal domain-containing protein [Maridesulfovibrio sp.]|uniref:phage antirepressor N-terminal domain-containing protein n=1 Tax=Maridesulfovibrio sp. TaxID=2795000 RepID=UPI0039EE7524